MNCHSPIAARRDALNRRFLTGDGSIHFADELSLPSPAAEHYPYELDSAAIAALKNTDFDAFSNALTVLFNVNYAISS